jgi:hypothetical protein
MNIRDLDLGTVFRIVYAAGTPQERMSDRLYAKLARPWILDMATLVPLDRDNEIAFEEVVPSPVNLLSPELRSSMDAVFNARRAMETARMKRTA